MTEVSFITLAIFFSTQIVKYYLQTGHKIFFRVTYQPSLAFILTYDAAQYFKWISQIKSPTNQSSMVLTLLSLWVQLRVTLPISTSNWNYIFMPKEVLRVLSNNWLCNVSRHYASGSRSETPGKFWNVVLKKDGEDQLDRSCETWRSVASSQLAEEYPTCNKKTEG